MRSIWAGALAGLSGWLVAAASADEVQWRPAASAPGAAKVPAVTLGRPVATLGRPVAVPVAPVTLDRPAVGDTGLQRVSFQAPLVRLQSAEGKSAAPMPSSLTAEPIGPPLHSGSMFAVGAPVEADASYRTGMATEPLPGGGPVSSTPFTMGEASAVEYGEEGFEDDGHHWLHGFYGKADNLLWWIKGTSTPVLATTGPAVPGGGTLGQPGTSVLFGGSNVHLNEFNGGRFTLGYWCDDCKTKGIEFTYFFIGQRTNVFSANSGQFPVITRPFFNLNRGVEDVEITASPGQANGVLTISNSHRLWGAETNFRCNYCSGCWYRVDLLAGFRFLELTDDLNITERISFVPGATVQPAGTQVLVSDRFGTRNQFYGGQVGTNIEMRHGRWTLDLLSKVALGSTHQVVNIQGDQTIKTPTGNVTTFQGGLLALPSNSGRFTRDRFSVVPEWGATIGYNVTDQLRLTVGYSFIYWSDVVRPSDQIDRGLNVQQIPNGPGGPTLVGPNRPISPFRSTDFWAQGLNFGIDYKY